MLHTVSGDASLDQHIVPLEAEHIGVDTPFEQGERGCGCGINHEEALFMPSSAGKEVAFAREDCFYVARIRNLIEGPGYPGEGRVEADGGYGTGPAGRVVVLAG